MQGKNLSLMIKNTINLALKKTFANNIWKLEIDSYSNLVAVELRDPTTHTVTFCVIDFTGNSIYSSAAPEEKEWTIDHIQQGFLVLKRVGSHTPVSEGIKIYEVASGRTTAFLREYQHIESRERMLLVRHQRFATGGEQWVDILSGELRTKAADFAPPFLQNKVQFPVNAPAPSRFVELKNVINPVAAMKLEDKYILCHHQQQGDTYTLTLSVFTLNQHLSSEVIMTGIKKMILQPFFSVDRHLFFLADNKREIVSYLV